MKAFEKIKAILDYLHLNIRQFAKNIGYARAQVIYDLTSGKTKTISEELANRIVATYPQIRKAWLLADDGEMLVGASSHEGKIPLLYIDSVGGMACSNIITDTSQIVERYYTFDKVQEGDIAIYQSGDSMAPNIPAWSILHLRQVRDWQDYLNYGAVYVIELADGKRITKEIQRSKEKPYENILCVSYNEKYPPQELSRKDINSVWKLLQFVVVCG